MNVQSSAPSYISPSVKIGSRQSLRRKNKAIDLRREMALAQRVGKLVLVILPVFLILQFALLSLHSGMERSIQLAAEEQLAVEDRNINLLAQKARLFGPASIEKLAGERLALYSPEKKQVGKFNRRYATFSFL